MPHILALDQGTTSSRALVFDHEGAVVASAQQEFEQFYPQPGWVEHDPETIWQSQLDTGRRALAQAGLAASDLDAIGIANQRETVVVWERASGQPIHRAIVWQDRRTAENLAQLESSGVGALVREKTGLLLDPYFSAAKVAWILDRVPGARARAERGELAAGTIDSWLLNRLTAGDLHVTDLSNASRTSLLNLGSGQWDEELLDLFDVPAPLLPTIVPSSGVVGQTHPSVFGQPIPLAGVAGDQQAALFGQLCTRPGMAKNTFGTGCFLLTHTGTRRVRSQHNLLTTVAWQLGDQPAEYALEGSVFVGGAAIQWLRDGLGILETAPQVSELAATVSDSGGVFVVPAFVGLGAPHWDPQARGSMYGLTRGTSAAHLARATLEGIAHQVADVLEAMVADTDEPILALRVDGGAAASDLLMQIQADLLDVVVERPAVIETTALGAAYLAGLGAGLWNSVDQIAGERQIERRFSPHMPAQTRSAARATWARAVQSTRAFGSPGPATTRACSETR